MMPPVWVVTARKPMAARWARLLSGMGLRSTERSSLSDVEPEASGMVLVDWGLISAAPRAALESLKARIPGMRVIVFADEDVLLGSALAQILGAGAADLLPSSGDDDMLMRRLKPHVAARDARRPAGPGDLRVDRKQRSVWVRRGGAWTPAQGVTRKEFDLLCVFLEYPGVCLTRGALMERLWGGRCGQVNPEVVDKHVGSLRKKLGRHGRRLETRRGKGYVLRVEGVI